MNWFLSDSGFKWQLISFTSCSHMRQLICTSLCQCLLLHYPVIDSNAIYSELLVKIMEPMTYLLLEMPVSVLRILHVEPLKNRFICCLFNKKFRANGRLNVYFNTVCVLVEGFL